MGLSMAGSDQPQTNQSSDQAASSPLTRQISLASWGWAKTLVLLANLQAGN